MTAEIYMILSGKGGVGKTTIFANLATSLARMGKETIVLDADLAMANLGLAFGFASCPVTLHEVLSGKAEIDKAIYKGPYGVKVIPGGDTIDGFQASDPEGLIDIIEHLKCRSDYLLIDTPVGLNEDIFLLLPLVDHVLILATPDLASMADALRMKFIAKSFERSIDGVILNRVYKSELKDSMQKIEQTMELNILEVIPEDPNIHHSAIEMVPLVVSLPKSPAARAIRHLADKIITSSPNNGKRPGIFHKVLRIAGRSRN